MNSKRLLFLLTAFIILHIVIVLVLPPPTRASDLTTQNIIAAINNERVARNLTALNENNLLDEAAQYKTDDMQTRHYFAHVDPDGHYIWDKIVAFGYTPYEQLGENIAINFYDTESLDDAWMQSPEHRANILNGGFVDQGMGLTMGDVSQGQYYSAIDNTFGTLVSEQNAKKAPVKIPVAATSAETPTPTPPTPSKPAATSTARTSTPTPVVTIRGAATTTAATSTPAAATSSTTSVATTQNTPPANSPAEIVNSPTPLTSAKANRYLALAFGLLLLIFLGHDTWKYIKEKGLHLDKKINNIALLILAIIVVGLMYWF